MPKRKLSKTPPEVIESLREALRQGRPVTDEEAVQIRGRIPALDGPGSGAIVVLRRGEMVFRRAAGKLGPDYREHPRTIDIKKQARDLLTLAAKLRRRPPVEAASAARRQRSKKTPVKRLLRKYGLFNRKAPALIAAELGVSRSYVRKVRGEMRLTESHV